MSISNGYTDLDTLKAVLGIERNDYQEDTALERLIEQVSRWVDEYCRRRFYAREEARLYTPAGLYLVETDDLLSVTALEILIEDAWVEETEYHLLPLNASLDGKPYTAIHLKEKTTNTFRTKIGSVRVTGSFGYAAVTPQPVVRATLLQCFRLWKREDAPFGVAGPNTFGQLTLIHSLDPDVTAILDRFSKWL